MPRKIQRKKIKPKRRKTAKKTTKTAKKRPVKPTRAKTKAKFSLTKHGKNPIISPKSGHEWESWQTFNPGVIHLDNKVHALYRSIGKDGLSRLGYAVSGNGLKVDERLPHPVYEHKVQPKRPGVSRYASGGSWGGAEDPRIVRVGEENKLYMTYTVCDGDIRVGLTSISVADFLAKKWNWEEPVLISPPGEVHKNWVIFPEKINGKYAILHSINPEVSVAYFDNLDFDGNTFIQSVHGGGPRKGCWDNWVRGVGPVPIRTKYGWLVLYHAMDNDWSKYKVGAMLLDLNDPTKILARSGKPVLEPSEHYENHGFKGGVVYASGAVVKNGKILVYYGGADSCVCVAHADFNKFVYALRTHKEPQLKRGKA
ncbi:hypothetical protein A2662_01275 [Candidatus Giovannonibacteria bacterium RIFCSPHIGHO2_01_FULL_45_33]|uniref:Glycosidase n=1 Tax=Candidatus Giovannonibacteria bacterium RIFCSPLOWO2_01_FULL_45_34 TaxID=1798351 RepID=A0A1F5WZD7_9BACT